MIKVATGPQMTWLLDDEMDYTPKNKGRQKDTVPKEWKESINDTRGK
jgi:hypothetical protein